jgi:hypothetical protein
MYEDNNKLGCGHISEELAISSVRVDKLFIYLEDGGSILL